MNKARRDFVKNTAEMCAAMDDLEKKLAAQGRVIEAAAKLTDAYRADPYASENETYALFRAVDDFRGDFLAAGGETETPPSKEET